MRGEILSKYAFTEIPDKFDKEIINRIIEKCNVYLTQNALGIEIADIDLRKENSSSGGGGAVGR